METGSFTNTDQTTTAPKDRILVVDDCRDILAMLKQSLQYGGYEVAIAESLSEARERLQTETFNLVLCDVCLPKGSGLNLLHELAPSAPDIAVIMMTGNADLNLAIDSLREGAFDFIPKPFRLEKILKVTARALARQQRLVAQKRLLEQRLETMARFTEDVHNPVFQIDSDGRILYANKASAYLLDQWGAAEGERNIPSGLLPLVARKFAGDEVDKKEIAFGERTYLFNVTEPVDGKLVYLYGYDTTDLKAAQEDLLKLKIDALEQARTDHLTGLPNRLSYSRAIATLRKPSQGKTTAFVMMDVNKFKQINDNFCHAMGDRVLVAIAQGIRSNLRPGDLIFRWGGDELLLVLPDMDSRMSVEIFLKELNSNVSENVRHRASFEVALSYGVAFWPDDGKDIEQVVLKADDALLRNKVAGVSTGEIHKQENHAPGDDQTDEEMSVRLTSAVQQKAIDVQFQPIINSTTGRCVSVEALARWNTHYGAVSPDRFIPLADSHGLAPSLGELIIDESLACLALLRKEGFEVDVSINLSQLQLQESAFAESLIGVAKSLEIDPNWICLEISEKYPLFNNSLYCNRLLGLQEAGFKIALDDFGTGFSTLQALADLPVNRIKLDRSLIQRCGTVKGDAILVSMVDLARSIKLELVAEGIESGQQLEHLKNLGIFLFQGSYFQRPTTQMALIGFLKDEPLPSPAPEVEVFQKENQAHPSPSGKNSLNVRLT